MPSPVHRGKLAYKFLFWFLLISLAPIVVVGFNLISISRDALKNQSLHNQESAAVGFANMTWNYITTYKNILSDAARQSESIAAPREKSDDLRAALAREAQFLDRIMQTHAAFLELSWVDLGGRELLRKGRFLGPSPPMRSFLNEASFQVALQRGEYVGTLERFQGLYPTLALAVPILDSRTRPPKTLGVLTGKISLNGLSTMLNQEFPEGRLREAAVVSSDGFLVAHSNPHVIFRPEAKLAKEITDVVLTQTSDKGGGEIRLSDGKKLLGAFAGVKDLGWVVYVQEPIESAYEAVPEMTSKTLWVLVWVIAVTILLSLAVAGHITQPIRLLRQAADRLSQGQFEDIPEMATTNDEIGDLAQTFLQMSESLREKTGELIHAKEELEKFTRHLERRVDARTRELKAAQDELIKKERLAAIGQMASVVGHEIRNPLAVINNSTYFIKTKLAADSAGIDPKITKHISIIESEIKQANGIINEILTFSRERPLKPVVLAVNNFLEEILAIHPFPSHIQVVREFDPRNPVLHIDPDEMRQAVRNLIGNAVEVMPQGGALKIMTEVLEGRWARISVKDSGPGIPADVLERIFAPFFTTKARGTGLGLAVVRKVVDRHQGKVDVETEIGKGSTFKIYLPLSAPGGGVEAGAAQPQAESKVL
ncbi:MAG: HAMP domain-containing protein [Elusimicrobia bacterium]|nr:HAMP domain-containing protein [Elusimicrobiota bacterium]